MINLSSMNSWELKSMYDDLEMEQLKISNKISNAENEYMRTIYEKECDVALALITDIKHEMERR